MLLTAILKRINIKNSDTDQYINITLDLNSKDLDINKLNKLHHKQILLKVIEDEELNIKDI